MGSVRSRRANVMLLAIAVALFATCALIHIVCGDFPKKMDVHPDEVRYLSTARSLFSGNGLVMRGEPSTFQKILYPLSLFPALMTPDGSDQVRFINVLSSLYAASSVFPAFLIASKLFRHPVPIVACMVLTLIAPDLMYSMTFMTESVFFPLALWVVYVCWRCFCASGKAEVALALLSGILCYIAYLCKEVAWMFVIAFVFWYIAAAIRKRRSVGRSAAVSAVFLLGFLVPFTIMKLTLFHGLFNSYSQFSFDILLSPYTVLFGLYSLVTDSLYFIIGFGVFPVLFLICTYEETPRKERDLLQFCLVSLFIGLCAVIFTISMREDVGHVELRQHLRYVAPLSVPLIMLFIRQVTTLDIRAYLDNPKRRALLTGVFVGFCALVAGFFGSTNLQQGFDNSQFHVMRWILGLSQSLPQEYFYGQDWTVSEIDASDGALLDINPVNWACRAAVIVYALLGIWFLTRKGMKTRLFAGAGICAIIAGFMVANSVFAYHYNVNAYQATDDEVSEICAISEQLAAREGPGDVVVLLEEGNTHNNNLIDTYLQDGAGDYRYYKMADFKKRLNSERDMAESGFEASSIGYILVPADKSISFFNGKRVKIGGMGNADGRFTLYRVDDAASSRDVLELQQGRQSVRDTIRGFFN